MSLHLGENFLISNVFEQNSTYKEKEETKIERWTIIQITITLNFLYEILGDYETSKSSKTENFRDFRFMIL